PRRQRPRRRPARHDGRHLGMDGDRVRRLPRLRRPPLPRVLRGLLPPGLPRPPRRLLGDAGARRDPDVPQLGPPPAAPDLLRGEARMGRMTSLRAARRTLADDALDGLTRPAKELPPKHFYDARGSELFDRIC